MVKTVDPNAWKTYVHVRPAVGFCNVCSIKKMHLNEIKIAVSQTWNPQWSLLDIPSILVLFLLSGSDHFKIKNAFKSPGLCVFFPHSKNMHVSFIKDNKLSIGVNDCLFDKVRPASVGLAPIYPQSESWIWKWWMEWMGFVLQITVTCKFCLATSSPAQINDYKWKYYIRAINWCCCTKM